MVQNNLEILSYYNEILKTVKTSLTVLYLLWFLLYLLLKQTLDTWSNWNLMQQKLNISFVEDKELNKFLNSIKNIQSQSGFSAIVELLVLRDWDFISQILFKKLSLLPLC